MLPRLLPDRLQESPQLFYTLLLISFCGLFYAYLIRPLRLELNEIHDNIAKMNVELEREEVERSRLKRSYAHLAAEKKHLSLLLSRVQGPSIDLLRSLEKLATSNRLEINWREPQKQKVEEPFSHRLLAIELVGDYHDLRRYLEGVSVLDRIMSIDSYEIKATGDSAKFANSLKAKLVLNVPKYTKSGTGTLE